MYIDIFCRALLCLNEKGFGLPVIAHFDNGVVFKFMPGLLLEEPLMRDKHIIG